MRIYPDTSTIGGCLDAEFAEHSLRFIDLVHAGEIVLLISDLLVRELAEAPAGVRVILEDLPTAQLERVTLDEEIEALRDAYLEAGILPSRWQDDAAHVAAASVAGADAIVSWNFRHIVRLDLMQQYNRVNAERGYRHLNIVTPVEVVYGSSGQENQDI